ncbi:small, acid-soluble spore protein, alpha/beta type [Alicyclobacillus sp. ALC3]|uniref:small, acid-soluble spore protein, alpha/beta type n=1 Tax=Alicyclobacillus sp. ALC3 TaxID=2796143 RepID=UPI0023798279|nr:small, acid-soluble spore protein, alpha/beta type [Alicyclobacillus sp. ALC3]WDL95128.1 small, acid-soluble spore protein, alpha/beta type [Alicyclobacillus sp. ALC3]
MTSRRAEPKRDSTSNADARDGLALRNLMEAMRYEVAQELGGPGAAEGQFGDWTTAQSGRFGAILYKRAKALLAAQGQSGAAAKYETSEALVPENGRDLTEDSVPKNRRSPKNRHKGNPHAKQRGQ